MEFRLAERQFIQINPGTEDAVVLALAGTSDDELAAGKLGIEAKTLAGVRRTLDETQGDCVLAFGGELSAAAQTVLAQLPQTLSAREGRRFLLHPLPLYNNSIGAHDIGLMNAKLSITQLLDQAGWKVGANGMRSKNGKAPDAAMTKRRSSVQYALPSRSARARYCAS